MKKVIDRSEIILYTTQGNVIEAWLSLVERSVRDAEAASSNLVASTLYGQLVKRLRRRPLTAQTRVRFPDWSFCFGLPLKAFFIKDAYVAQLVAQLIRNE